jgi:hypothetical protein
MIRFHWLKTVLAASAVTGSAAFLVAYQPPTDQSSPAGGLSPLESDAARQPTGAVPEASSIPAAAAPSTGRQLLGQGFENRPFTLDFAVANPQPPTGEQPRIVTWVAEDGAVHSSAMSTRYGMPILGATPPGFQSYQYAPFDTPESLELQQKITTLLQAYFQEKPEEAKREIIRKELTTLVEQEFKVRMALREGQLAKLEEQVKALREKIEQRSARRDAIVGRRVSELLQESSEDDWDDSMDRVSSLYRFPEVLNSRGYAQPQPFVPANPPVAPTPATPPRTQ